MEIVWVPIAILNKNSRYSIIVYSSLNNLTATLTIWADLVLQSLHHMIFSYPKGPGLESYEIAYYTHFYISR